MKDKFKDSSTPLDGIDSVEERSDHHTFATQTHDIPHTNLHSQKADSYHEFDDIKAEDEDSHNQIAGENVDATNIQLPGTFDSEKKSLSPQIAKVCSEDSEVKWGQGCRTKTPYTEWAWRQEWLIKRDSGRKATNPDDFVSTLLQQVVAEERRKIHYALKKMPLWLHVVKDEGCTTQQWARSNKQYMAYTFYRPRNINWNGPISVHWANELFCRKENHRVCRSSMGLHNGHVG